MKEAVNNTTAAGVSVKKLEGMGIAAKERNLNKWGTTLAFKYKLRTITSFIKNGFAGKHNVIKLFYIWVN